MIFSAVIGYITLFLRPTDPVVVVINKAIPVMVICY
jgi:hypothetical protein